MSFTKSFCAMLRKIFNISESKVNVDKELANLKSIRDRLNLAKQQSQTEIAERECTKLDLDVELQDAINALNAEHAKQHKKENDAIEIEDSVINEVDLWLGVFPTK